MSKAQTHRNIGDLKQLMGLSQNPLLHLSIQIATFSFL